MEYFRDYSNVKNDQGLSKNNVPPGKYAVQIEKYREKETQKGDPIIYLRCVVIWGPVMTSPIYDSVVLFPPDAKGAGMTKHFLKCIGQPVSGAIDPSKWVGKQYIVTMGIDKQQTMSVRFRDSMPVDLTPSNAS